MFEADPGVLGKTIRVNRQRVTRVTIVGVTPPECHGIALAFEGWVPLVPDTAGTPGRTRGWRRSGPRRSGGGATATGDDSSEDERESERPASNHIANLLLARSTEFGARLAVGTGRRRLAQPVI